MQVQLDELKALKQKMAEQAEQREEMNKINQQLHHFACLEKEESRLADLKVTGGPRIQPILFWLPYG